MKIQKEITYQMAKSKAQTHQMNGKQLTIS